MKNFGTVYEKFFCFKKYFYSRKQINMFSQNPRNGFITSHNVNHDSLNHLESSDLQIREMENFDILKIIFLVWRPP